jgi:ribonuclease HI
MVLNDISTRHSLELFWVPGQSRVYGNVTADQLAREGTVYQFAGPERALRVSRQNKTKKYKTLGGQPSYGNVARPY